MISYAQNFEDVILNRVFRDVSAGFYVDVGAMDPVFDSVTKAFYERGWSGINIEPNKRFHAAMMADRARDINLNVAVGESEQHRPFYLFAEHGISTFDAALRDNSAGLGYSWTETSCHVTTLAAVCREYVKRPIDFLKIDAEGWEGPVLRSADWEQFRPTVLVVEAVEPVVHTPRWTEWEPFLTDQCGYTFVYFDGLNRFYLRRESLHLQPCFAVPANVLDGFQLYAVTEAHRRRSEAEARLTNQLQRSSDLEDQLLQCRLRIGRLSESAAILKSSQQSRTR